MGYYVRELPNKKTAPLWKLQFVSAKRKHAINKTTINPRRTWDITQDRWNELGFHKFMSPEEATARQKQLNAQLAIKRREEQRILTEEKEKIISAKYAGFIPEFYHEEFEQKYFFSLNPRSSKLLCSWKVAQKIITELQLEPSDWYDSARVIHRMFLKQKYSLSYCHKILRVMNSWGFFFSRKIGKPFFPVPPPKGYERAQILEAYFERRGLNYKESDPIQPMQLRAVRGKISTRYYNWLYLSVWLGLRPLEVDQLKNPELMRIMTDKSGTPTLWIYQTKLVAIAPRYRWKLIPLIFKEQKACLEIIESKDFSRPLTKTVKNYFGLHTNLYGGRKGFTDLMLSKRQKFVHISQWMGHSSIERTWKTYKSRRLTHYSRQTN